MSTADIERKLEGFRNDFEALRSEIAKVIVGQERAIEAVLSGLVAGGHVLIEGLPGMGKTLLARTLADVVDLSFQRIQSTPDLMPTDVIGTYVIMETPQGRRTFEFQKGPLFANVVLIDQINRTTPKTQSVFLDAMDEDAIHVSTETFHLPEPFCIVATQNPLEMEGTFPMPEAQIDRFLFKTLVTPPDVDMMERILLRTTEPEPPMTRQILGADRLIEMGQLIRQVPVADEIRRFGVTLVMATDPSGAGAPEPVRQYARYGAGPRGAEALFLGAKIRAILAGRYHVSRDDLKAAAYDALRHRVILNFEGQAENVSPDTLIENILENLLDMAKETD